MTARWFDKRLAVLGAALILSAPLTFHAAEAARAKSGHGASQAHVRAIQTGMHSSRTTSGWGRHAITRRSSGGGLQCVPFARENSGIELTGNANTWWNSAEGVYERGAKPEVGSILNFRSTGRMRMGHVAVVTNVIDSRKIEIDHANWGRGRITRNMTVVDVSPGNDWTAVRVELGDTGDYGSIYPTYGFIYDRPDKGTMLANTNVTPAPVLNAAVRDLRPAADRVDSTEPAEEVAEAVDDTAPRYSRYTRHRSSRAAAKTSRTAAKPSVVRTSAHPAAKPHNRRHRS